MYKIVILVHSLFLPIFQTDFDMSKDFKSKWRSKVDDKTVAGLSRHSCTSIQFDIMTTSVMLKQWVLYILTITMALSNKDKPKWVCLVLVLFFFFFLLSLLKFSLNLQFSWTVRSCQMGNRCFSSTCLPQASLLHLESD